MNKIQFKIVEQWTAGQEILDYAKLEYWGSVTLVFHKNTINKFNEEVPMALTWFEINTYDQFLTIKSEWLKINPIEDISWFDPLIGYIKPINL